MSFLRKIVSVHARGPCLRKLSRFRHLVSLLTRGKRFASLLPKMAGGFDLWEKARVDEAADFNNSPPVRAVFGYGSLIFRPGFPYVRSYPACVRGYLRRFWQRSCDHRGTIDMPGRVVTLVRAEDMPQDVGAKAEACEVHGVAYEVADESWDEVIEQLDIRERHGYVRTVADLFQPRSQMTGEAQRTTGSGERIGQAVVYYAFEPHTNAAYAGPEAVAQTADVIAIADGPSGRNDAYLSALISALDDNGLPEDAYLAELSTAVKQRQSS